MIIFYEAEKWNKLQCFQYDETKMNKKHNPLPRDEGIVGASP